MEYNRAVLSNRGGFFLVCTGGFSRREYFDIHISEAYDGILGDHKGRPNRLRSNVGAEWIKEAFLSAEVFAYSEGGQSLATPFGKNRSIIDKPAYIVPE